MKKILLSLSLLATVIQVRSQGNLVCQFDFTAGSLNDASANLYTGTAYGSATTDYDRFNNNASSYRCFGGSDYIQTDCPGVSGSGNRTISFWTKVNIGSGGGPAVNYGGGPLGEDFNVYLNTGGSPGITLDISDETKAFSCTTEDGKWHQFVLVFDNSSGPFMTPGMQFYRDGVLMTNSPGNYNPNGHTVNTNTYTQLKIGGGDFNVDDVKMFSSPFSSSQVDSLFVAEAPANPCIVHKYDFSGDANDGVGSSNGVNNGATLTTDRFLNPNKAYAFNGSSDYIDVPAGINLNGNFTLGYWAQRPSLDANWHIVLSQGDGNPSTGLHCGLTGTLGGQNFGCDFAYDGQYDTTNASKLNWQQWYVTFDSSTKAMNFYCNGVPTFSGSTTNQYLGSGFLRIGAGAWGGNNFLGKIDDIKLFNCVMNATQIDSIYQREKVNCSLGVSLTATDVLCNGQGNGSITSNVTGAIGSVAYSWQPNLETTANLFTLSSGSYTLTVTDDAGCSVSQSASVYEPGQLYVSAMYITQPFCSSSCDGSANYYTTGGSGGESWSWSPSGQTGNGSANGLCPGTHTVTVTDINGCVASDIFTLTGPPPIFANISSVTPISCFGVCDGSIGAAPSGGMPGGGALANPSGSSGGNVKQHTGTNSIMGPGTGYTVTWQPGSIMSDTISGLCAGSYTVTVTDGYGCSIVDSFNLAGPAVLSSVAGSASPTCPGVFNGSAYVTTTGGTSPYTSNWSNAMSGDSITGLDSISNLVVTVTDANGCTAGDTVNIGAPTPFFITLTPAPALCFGQANGSVSSSVTGATGTIVYSWLPGMETTASISSLAAGSYTLSITDDAGCTASENATVGEPGELFVNQMALTQPFCPGSCNGGAFYYTSGGSGGESWVWSPSGQTGNGSANGLCAGSQTVTVTDVNGCVASDIFTLIDPPALSANISVLSSVSCNGICDASVGAAPSGGTPAGGLFKSSPGGNATMGTGLQPYTVTWQPVNIQSDTIYNLCAGTYSCTVMDGNGCTITDSVVFTEPAAFAVVAGSTNPLCPGHLDGTAFASASGGSAPYSYNWSNNMFGDTLTGLDSISNLSVHAIDNNGCSADDTISVAAPNPFYLTLTPSNSTCGGSTGSVSTSITGGTAPYSYYWNSGDVTTNISSLVSGLYFLEVYDVNGCYASDFAVVNDANGPSISLNSVTNVTCSGANNGAVDVSISGGTQPYSIQWSTGDDTEDISSIPGGSYDLVVTDSIGCIASYIATVNEPQPIEIYGSYLGSGCGFATGRADAVVNGGTPPYSYLWNADAANQTTSSAFNVASGIYSVIVTDNHGCIDSAYVSVSDTAGPAVYVDSTMNAGCILNGGNGSIFITVDGNGPFTYHWNNGATTEDVNGLGIGIFGVIVTDTNGCRGGASAYIHGLRPGTAQICLASVDTATNHNIIVWNDTVVGVALYEIYRETSVPNQYNLIATIPAGTTNTFEDTIANADNKPWRYKITATDSCDIQSHYSLSHKPIHLVVTTNINGSADLSWDQYQGVNYPYYYILRYHFTTGWVLVDSVASGSSLVYNDPAGLLPADSNYYFIEVKPNVSCGATRSIVNTSRSNIKNQIVPKTLELDNRINDKTISVFPNPSLNEFNVRFDLAGKYALKVYDVRGRLVSDENAYASSGTILQIKSADWAHGVYFLQVIRPDGTMKNFKLVKQ